MDEGEERKGEERREDEKKGVSEIRRREERG